MGQQCYSNFKAACFVKYLSSMLTDFHKTSITGILVMRWSKWGATALCYFKTAHFVKYLCSMLMDFYETSITGILFIGLSKISCIWKTFCIILYFLYSIFTHTHIYIHVCMLMCLTTIFLCQMQSWNQCACYILAHLCAILIPSAIGIWILKGVMRYAIFWVNQFK